jgi:hypothetical protein
MKTTYRTVKPPSDHFHCRPPYAKFCLLPTERTEKVNANILILSWSDEKRSLSLDFKCGAKCLIQNLYAVMH